MSASLVGGCCQNQLFTFSSEYSSWRGYNVDTSTDKFRQALASAGIEPHEQVIANGKLHRFHVDGDKPHKKNGWYVLHEAEDFAAGAFGCHKRQIKEKWRSRDSQSMTVEERARYKATMERIRKQADEEQARGREECRTKSKAIWDKGLKADERHQYLTVKGIKPFAIKQSGDALIIPVQDFAGVLHGLQFISGDGSKKFKTGTAKVGHFCRIPGDKTGPILICEGYATGASLHEATGHSIVVAFDAGNLRRSNKATSREETGSGLIVCSDNDQWTDGNPGITNATEAAREAGALLAVPEFNLSENEIAKFKAEKKGPTDFNDLHQLEGIEAVQHCIKAAKAVTSNIANVASAEWPSIIPLNSLTNLPQFPVDVLPGIGREMVKAVTEVYQVDAGFPAGVYLAALATAMQRKAGVSLASHREPLSIYVCPILDSGERKSSTLSVMTRPLYDYQNDKAERMKAVICEAIAADKVRQAQLGAKEKEASKAKELNDRERLIREIADIQKEITDNPVPPYPLFIMDDVTPEKLGDTMTVHGERMSIISAEGGIFGIMAGLYSKGGANFDILLKAHAGDSWSAHRMSRGACYMEAPALTLCVSVQSDVIREIGENRQFKGRGLLARFLFSMNGGRIGHRKLQTTPIAPEIAARYRAHLWDLMDIPPMNCDLNLTPSALEAWAEFYHDAEADLKEGGDMEGIKEWGSKLPGAAARIAALLHFAIHGQSGATLPIEAETVHAATSIASYYAAHALAVFGFMGEDPRIESARLILEYIDRHKPERFTGRDVMRHKNALKTMDAVDPGLKVLTERSYIALLDGAAYAVNPQYRNQENH